MNGIYTDKENLKVVFSYLIFNVASINKKYGSLSKFINDFDLGGMTNGKLYAIAEMAQENASAAQDTAASSKSLSELSTQLEGTIQHFKI